MRTSQSIPITWWHCSSLVHVCFIALLTESVENWYIWEIQLVTLVIHHASLVLLGIVTDIKLHVDSKRKEYFHLISCSDYHSLAWILSSIVNIYFSHAILKRTVLSKLLKSFKFLYENCVKCIILVIKVALKNYQKSFKYENAVYFLLFWLWF